MNRSSQLAIAIPTYNRSEVLKENFEIMLPEIIENNIPVYISDDSNNSYTEEFALKLKDQYSNIFYRKNTPSLGHDKNCIATLSLPKEKYIWYLGDSVVIRAGALRKILEQIAHNKNNAILMSFACQNRAIDFPSGAYKFEEVFNQLSWYLTMTGCTVYCREYLNLTQFNCFAYRNFPQLAILLEMLWQNPQKTLHWVNENFVEVNHHKKSYWNTKVFEVFFDDLSNSLRNLSARPDSDEISNVVKQHALQSGLLSVKSLLKMRIENVYNHKILHQYKSEFLKYSDKPFFVLAFLAALPFFMLKIIYRILKKQ